MQSSSSTNGQWKWLWYDWSLWLAHRCLLNSQNRFPRAATFEFLQCSLTFVSVFVSQVSCWSSNPIVSKAVKSQQLHSGFAVEDSGCKGLLYGLNLYNFMNPKQGLSEREHSCMRAWFTWINKLWFGPVLTKSKVQFLCSGSIKVVKKSVSNGFGVHWESGAYDLLLSISLNMYLAQKEAWEQWAERCRESGPALWSHRWGNQHSQNTLPAPQIWSRIKYSQDINIMVK